MFTAFHATRTKGFILYQNGNSFCWAHPDSSIPGWTPIRYDDLVCELIKKSET